MGPQPDGIIQPEFQERLRAIGDWLSVNGDSIYGTTYGPVGTSLRTPLAAKVFVHVLTGRLQCWSSEGLDPKVISAHLLATRPLKFRQTEGKLQIDLPPRT